MSGHVLILAGTAEGRALAETLTEARAGHPGLRVTASLAGVTAAPAPIAAETRRGGFGAAEGLGAWLKAQRVAALVDATHPFAARMAANAAAAARATATPRLKLLRPPWAPVGDWRPMPDLVAAAAALPTGARPLLTVGRRELAPFAARPDLTCLLRSIEPVADLPAHIRQITARPPFALDQELALMRAERITHLVAKNAGGPARARLDAAAQLGLPLVIVDRPTPPSGPFVASVDEAVAWVLATAAEAP